jgi:hypothetical protein
MSGIRIFTLGVVVSIACLTLSASGGSPSIIAPPSNQAGNADGSAGPTPPQAFAPVDPGPASALWHSGSLTAQERVYIAHAAQAANIDEQINAAYASATTELGERATHLAAARQLGVEGLAGEGVVP